LCSSHLMRIRRTDVPTTSGDQRPESEEVAIAHDRFGAVN
jgi:hypothetical protein